MIGNVRREVADVIGVSNDVAVVVSGADTQCGLLGLGVSRAGQVGSRRGMEHTAAYGDGYARVRQGAADMDGLSRGEWALESGEYVRGRRELVPVACRYDVGGRGRAV